MPSSLGRYISQLRALWRLPHRVDMTTARLPDAVVDRLRPGHDRLLAATEAVEATLDRIEAKVAVMPETLRRHLDEQVVPDFAAVAPHITHLVRVSQASIEQHLQDLTRRHDDLMRGHDDLIHRHEVLIRGHHDLIRFHHDLVRRQEDVIRRLAPDGLFPDPGIELETDAPVAVDSADHQHPRGVANDNTRHPRFVMAVERLLGRSLRVLDIGCAGGGLIMDFLQRGHLAIGIEGSDYASRQQIGCWPLLPRHLLTADATRPFTLRTGTERAKFDLITAWEVLEHLPEESLPIFFRNVTDHLAPGGLFVASVATFVDADATTGVVWHVTVQDRHWWTARMAAAGLMAQESPFALADHPRGSGNPALAGMDWNAGTNPEMGFHIAARVGPAITVTNQP